MNLKRVYLTIIFLFAISLSFGQKKKFLSLEVVGVGGIASLSYDHQILEAPFKLYLRSGLSIAPIDPNNGTAIVFPVLAHGLIGKENHYVDIGIGQALTVTTKGSLFLRAPASFGYRYQPQSKRYYLRLAYTPIISFIYNYQWEHWGGITFGYQINKNR